MHTALYSTRSSRTPEKCTVQANRENTIFMTRRIGYVKSPFVGLKCCILHAQNLIHLNYGFKISAAKILLLRSPLQNNTASNSEHF